MEITLKELTEIIRSSEPANQKSFCTKPSREMGQQIVVLDRGFVYVGKVSIDGDFVNITGAKNIRYWGTKNGLGELRDGPLKETKLDDIGEVIAPMKSVIHFVPRKGF